MTERVSRLRQQSVDTKPYISTERAELITHFYKSGAPETVSAPVARAMALRHIMEHRTVYVGEGELIVGERGPAPRATPTYPELCCHSLDDLEIINRRERIPFAVSDEARRVYRDEIIPFWRGTTIRERLFALMSPEWHKAFDAGVFTEFMEQRAFGHAILDEKIYHRGLLDFQRDIRERRGGLDRLVALIRTYFSLGGHHVQFNVVSADLLREAQRAPEAHRSLIVRVAGYSDYFVDVGKGLQDEIIARTEHETI